MDSSTKKKLTVIVGPTASGKTDLGIALAKAWHGSVISADSRQVYAGMNIGTAKPEEAWKDEAHELSVSDCVDSVDHYLLNIRPPDKKISLATWQAAAIDLAQKLSNPLLVGGTMLYVESVIFNYQLPSVAQQPELRNQLEKKPVEKLWQELGAKDPTALKLMDKGNKRRIVRALEVIATTQRPFSELRQQSVSPFDITLIGLFPGWDVMRERLEERHRAMLERTLVPETEALIKKYGASLPLLETMNYRQAKQIIDGSLTLEEALADTLRVNLRYAHRQMSWWNRAVYSDQHAIRWFASPTEAVRAIAS